MKTGWVWAAAALGVSAAVVMLARRRPLGMPASAWSRDDMIALIRSESELQGVDPTVALVFAQVETGIQNLIGDQGSSFGPFQLQQRFHIPEGLDPRDPGVTIPLGVGLIRRLLERTGGDVLEARILYVCGSVASCSAEKRAIITTRLEEAMA